MLTKDAWQVIFSGGGETIEVGKCLLVFIEDRQSKLLI
jgi:hypothetical protein